MQGGSRKTWFLCKWFKLLTGWSITRPRGRVWIETSTRPSMPQCSARITRPRGRVWIETDYQWQHEPILYGITRPRGRVWIETAATW